MLSCSPAEFSSALMTGALAEDSVSVRIPDGEDLAVRAMTRPTDPGALRRVVFVFHGAIDQTKIPYPYFEGTFLRPRLRDIATVISIADPSMKLHRGLRACFYAGHQGGRVVESIAAFLAAVVDHVRPSRLVFFGGSSASHPALLHSARFPDSICVVKNPITCISQYVPQAVLLYRNLCWPGCQGDLSSLVQDQVGDLYRGEVRNRVIYLQNPTDSGIIRKHMIPFFACLTDLSNVLPIMQFESAFIGHSYPPRVVADWTEAAVLAPDPSVLSIARSVKSTPTKTSAHPQTPKISARDIEIADLVARREPARDAMIIRCDMEANG